MYYIILYYKINFSIIFFIILLLSFVVVIVVVVVAVAIAMLSVFNYSMLKIIYIPYF